MFGVLAFTAVALVIIIGSAALRQQSLNARPGRHRVVEYAAAHRWTSDSCWKPVCGCPAKHQLPPQAIIDRLRREEARSARRYALTGVRPAAAL